MMRQTCPEGELCLDTCNALGARATRAVTLTVTDDIVIVWEVGR